MENSGALFGVVFGVIVMAMFARPAYEGLQLDRWIKVDGEVSRVYIDESVMKKGRFQGWRTYTYGYMGVSYTKQASCTPVTSSRSEAERAIAAYPVGERLAIWVYTWRPSQSKLVPGHDAHALTGVCIGAFFVALCLLIYFKAN